MRLKNELSIVDKHERGKYARKLTLLSSHKISTFLLENCDALIMINTFDDNWKEFYEFIETFIDFKRTKRMAPSIFFVLRGIYNE